MSEEKQRFTITGGRSISDHTKKRLYDVSDFDGIISVTECLNELNNEVEYLKKVVTSTDELLVNQFQENQKIKRTIEEAHYNERTKLGRSVLKQLLEKIQ